MKKTEKIVKHQQYMRERDHIEQTLMNLSIDCFELCAYDSLLCGEISLPNQWIAESDVFVRAFGNFTLHLKELQDSYKRLLEILDKKQKF